MYHTRVPTKVYDGEVVDMYFDNPSEQQMQCDPGGNAVLSSQANALQRARSGGMVRRGQAPYYTTNTQYLYSRNRTLAQNETRLLRYGDAATTPGAAGSLDNVYASNTATQCPGNSGGPTDTTEYYPVYHHPGNPQYNTQGAVSAAERIWRLRYNATVMTGPALNTPYGVMEPNALAFVNGKRIFDLKDRIGAPVPCHPHVAADGSLQCLPLYRHGFGPSSF